MRAARVGGTMRPGGSVRPRGRRAHGWSAGLVAGLLLGMATQAAAQYPVEGEVRQLVTFRFQPGRMAEALSIYENQVIPLYRLDPDMLSSRGLREVESPVPLDLVLIRGFRGMAGMDRSNEGLGRLSEEAGTSIGSLYGSLANLSTGHDDQFVEMLPALGNGDPTSKRLVALVWYRLDPREPGRADQLFSSEITAWERARGTPASTGRFLLSDGWHYLRFVGFDSLGAYQQYWTDLSGLGAGRALERATVRRREVILAVVPQLTVR